MWKTITWVHDNTKKRPYFCSACTQPRQWVVINVCVRNIHSASASTSWLWDIFDSVCRFLSIIDVLSKFTVSECSNYYSNMTSFFRFVEKRAIYRLGIISLAHAVVHMTDLPVVNVHVDELSSTRIWQHKLCSTLSGNVNINYCLPIKVYYHICTLR